LSSVQKYSENSDPLKVAPTSFLYQDGVTPRSSPCKNLPNARRKSQSLEDLPLSDNDKQVRRKSQGYSSLDRKTKEKIKKIEKRKKATAKRAQSQLRPSSSSSFTSFLTNHVRKSPSSFSIDKKLRKKEKNDRRSVGFLWSPKSSETNRLSASGTPSSGYHYRRSYDPSYQSSSVDENSSVSIVSSDRSRSSTPQLVDVSSRNSIEVTIPPKNKIHYNNKQVNCDNEMKKKENGETSTHQELFAAIKRAEVDINGGDRKTSLRRKMTVLSRDPNKNEKMLKKRALQRELKAKEQELEYYNQLLKNGISSVTNQQLHLWINQHLSLVADMGTIKHIVRKKQRETVASVDFFPPKIPTESKQNKNNFELLVNMPKEVKSSEKLKNVFLEEDDNFEKCQKDFKEEAKTLDGRSPSIETLINNINIFMKNPEKREKIPIKLDENPKTTVNEILIKYSSNNNGEKQEPTSSKNVVENYEKNINFNNNKTRIRPRSHAISNSDKVFFDNKKNNGSFQNNNGSSSYLETDL